MRASENVISIFVWMRAQWAFGGAYLVVLVYTMVGWENIMYEFGEVSSLIEASLESLSMGCPIDSEMNAQIASYCAGDVCT